MTPRFQLINNFVGWLVFAIAAVSYTLTVEQTASFWDCGEFIAVSYRLQVPHPPGAPLYLLLGRLFSFLAMGDPQQVAYWINMESVLASAFTILFLYWSCVLLGRHLLTPANEDGTFSPGQSFALMGSAAVGALAYTYSDSFWFSAVEAEVYASSSFFTAFVVWALLKWERIGEDEARLGKDDPETRSLMQAKADKWIILTAYMVGLSIGVHLLNLVAIPALALLIFYKRSPELNPLGLIVTLGLSGIVVIGILEGVIVGLPSVAGQFEVQAVNTLGLPFGTGVAFFVLLLFGSLVYGIYSTSGDPRKITVEPVILTLGSTVFMTFIFGASAAGDGQARLIYCLIGLAMFWGPYLASGRDLNKTVVFSLPMLGFSLLLSSYLFFGALAGLAVGVGAWYLFFEDRPVANFIDRLDVKPINTTLLCFAFILVGYASYGIIPIRSNDNPPINENAPTDIISFVSYLKREQYGDRPLLYGPSFRSEPKIVLDESTGRQAYARTPARPRYRKGENKYEVYQLDSDLIYESSEKMLLPRIYSRQPGHPRLYEDWVPSLAGNQRKPTFGENIGYLFRYQFGHMYWRYFLWNFAGRETDEKEAGWLSGFESDENLPHDLKVNKARNKFYFLPLFFGLLGLVFQLFADGKRFAMTLLLFFLTGLALVLYLNSPPVEPRERDYIYVGSFYVFCMWIGFGVLAVYQSAMRMLGAFGLTGEGLRIPAAVFATVVSLGVPTIMAVEGWDNHNRQGRFHSVDQARNTLASCAPNAVLFTGGDNDTFPLWYVQSVEGYRTDVRVVVLSYLSTDWYIDQMKSQMLDSPPLPIELPRQIYRSDTTSYFPIAERPEFQLPDGKSKPIDLEGYMQLVRRMDKRIFVPLQGGKEGPSLVSRAFKLDIDKSQVIKTGTVPASKQDRIVDEMVFSLDQNSGGVLRSDIVILDMLANFGWSRPLYFNNTSANTTDLNLREYMHLEGMAYRVMPVKVSAGNRIPGEFGEVNVDRMLENVSEFQFRGFDNPDAYHDEEYRKFGSNMRNAYWRLAQALYDRGDTAQALSMLDESRKRIPDEAIPYSYFLPRYVKLYHQLGEDSVANELGDIVIGRAMETINYVNSKGRRDQLNERMFNVSMYSISILDQGYFELAQGAVREVDRLKEEKTRLDSAYNSDGAVMVEEEYLSESARLDRQIEAASSKEELYMNRYQRTANLMQQLQGMRRR